MLQSFFQVDKNDMQGESGASGEWNFRSKDGSKKSVYWSQVSEYPPMPGWKSWKVRVDITELKATCI